MSQTSPIIRLAPLLLGELPTHGSFESDQAASGRPDLLTFVLTVLDQGRALLHPTAFNLNFKHHSSKSSPPSNNDVNVLSRTVTDSELNEINWASPEVPRSKPRNLTTEFWYARRSLHFNLSVKKSAATASWPEFVFGLKCDHSKHECDFTPTIYDARLVVDWNNQLQQPEIVERLRNRGHDESKPNYSHVTMEIFEMCHKMPSPLSPRCFPVLVITATISQDEFIAVTLPVQISSFKGAFYSNGRNKREGTDSQMKKEVVLGAYCAIEGVRKYEKHREPSSKPNEGKVHSREEEGEEIQWIMATASNAKGNVPMGAQRMGVPGAIVKDVGLFLKWIKKVPESEILDRVAQHDAGT